MKKIVTALLSTATIAGIMVTGTIAGAEQVVDGREGETSGDVTVRGSSVSLIIRHLVQILKNWINGSM